MLVEIINNADDLDFGITLSANGAIITGTLVSAEAYGRGVAEMLRKAQNLADPEIQGFDALFTQFADQRQVEREERKRRQAAAQENGDEEDSPQLDPARFVHLKNAVAVLGSEISEEARNWWRVRLEDVDGWSVGFMSRGR
ncbi:hypothetical protein [Microbispora sp. CA-102843]|uniref:hypothetical protein n=1 Tax=Microbispora sp. CA-102843 TaxID=3239952 RepID=UPI003D914A2B